MEEPAIVRLRAELTAALSANTDRLQTAIRSQLAGPMALATGQRLQLEIDPYFFGIELCATEETILPGGWLDAALPEDWMDRAENVLGGWNAIISAELCPWLADCWQAAGGPAAYSPAYLFFHGYQQEQFDLERRCWTSCDEAPDD